MMYPRLRRCLVLRICLGVALLGGCARKPPLFDEARLARQEDKGAEPSVRAASLETHPSSVPDLRAS